MAVVVLDRGGCMVVGLVIASHGLLAEGLKAAAEMIMGAQERLVAAPLTPAATLDEYRVALDQAVVTVDEGQGVLIMTDLFGGSPCNTAAHLLDGAVEVVTGVNLPMLLEVLANRQSCGPGELARRALTAMRESGLRMGEVLGR